MKYVLVGFLVLVSVFGVVGLFGFLIPEKKTANAEFTFKHNSEVIWLKMRDIEGQKSWRQQLGSITIMDNSLGKEAWIENSKSGASVKLRTTLFKEKNQWGMETYDSPFQVKWLGELQALNQKETLVKFSYESTVTNPYFRILSLSFLNLESMIQSYALELKSELDKDTMKE